MQVSVLTPAEPPGWQLSKGGKSRDVPMPSPGPSVLEPRREAASPSPASTAAKKAQDRTAPVTRFKILPSDRSGSERSSKTRLPHGTHLSLPLRSMAQRVAACLQWHHAGAKRPTRGAARRKDSLELTPALNSTPTSPLARQPAPGAAQAPRGRHRQLREAKCLGARH